MPVAVKTVRTWLHIDDTVIQWQQENPKKIGSLSYDRYEKYKGSRTVREAKKNGAEPCDFKNDHLKGFFRILDVIPHKKGEDKLETKSGTSNNKIDSTATYTSNGKGGAREKAAAAALQVERKSHTFAFLRVRVPVERESTSKGVKTEITTKEIGKGQHSAASGKKRKGVIAFEEDWVSKDRFSKWIEEESHQEKAEEVETILATPSVADFFAFVRERESIRIRREVYNQSPPWTEDLVMRKTRLTNVDREMDKTTKAMRRITHAEVDAKWTALSRGDPAHPGHSKRKAWTQAQLDLAGLTVFNYALWRAFGTLEYAEKLGFLKDWGPNGRKYAEDVAVKMSRSGIPVFTDAYNPARKKRSMAVASLGREEQSLFRRLVQSTFEPLDRVWEARISIARKALETSSWKETAKRLMEVSGYGGTGFLAKEVLQDLLHTPLFRDELSLSLCVDENDWCAIGPGARRGLNRLAGRDLDYGLQDRSIETEMEFLKELKDLYAQRHKNAMWPSKLLGLDTQDLRLHDIQFQLCEFDKYLRAKHEEGSVRAYSPPRTISSGAQLVRRKLRLKVITSSMEFEGIRLKRLTKSFPDLEVRDS